MKEQDVRNVLSRHGLDWDDFIKWMIGKTVSVDKDGNEIYYWADVQAFLLKDVQPEADFD